MSTGLVQDIWVIGLPDRYWGQKVVAVYVPINSQIAVEQIIESIKGQISKYKMPKIKSKIKNKAYFLKYFTIF